MSTFTRVNLRGWGGDGDIFCGDGVGTGTEAVGMGSQGWKWVQCSRGRVGIGFSLCLRADFYTLQCAFPATAGQCRAHSTLLVTMPNPQLSGEQKTLKSIVV